MSVQLPYVCLAYRGRRSGRIGNNGWFGNDRRVCNDGSGGAFRNRVFREVRLRLAVLSGRILWRIRRRGVRCLGFMLSAVKRVEQGDRCKNYDRRYQQKKHEQKRSVSSRIIFLTVNRFFHRSYYLVPGFELNGSAEEFARVFAGRAGASACSERAHNKDECKRKRRGFEELHFYQ